MSAVLRELVVILRSKGYQCTPLPCSHWTIDVWDGPGGDRITYTTDARGRMTRAAINALPVHGPDRPGKLLRYLRTATS